MRYWILLLGSLATSQSESAWAGPEGCPAPLIKAAELDSTLFVACARKLSSVEAVDSNNSSVLYNFLAALAMRATVKPDKADVDAAKRIIGSLNKRGDARPLEHRVFLMILLDNDLLDEARHYWEEHNSLQKIPFPALKHANYQITAAPASYWRFDEKNNTLEKNAVNLSVGLHIVVMSSPGCEFCKRAVAEFGKDDQLARIMREKSIWISRPELEFGVSSYYKWNHEHPDEQMHLVTDASQWPMPEQWATPQFWFIKDGKVIVVVRGWNSESASAIQKALSEIGLS